MKIVKMHIENNASFHFGDTNGHLNETFSSDRLFSALTNNIRLMYGTERIADFVSLVEGNKLGFSSACFGLEFLPKGESLEKRVIYFLPRPKIDIYFSNDTYRSYKEFKKIEYVSINLFKRFSASWNREKDAVIIVPEDVRIVSKKFALLKEELAGISIEVNEWEFLSFMTHHVQPGVEVNRLNSKSENYFTREDIVIRYQETKNYVIKPFFYFYVNGEIPDYVRAAIQILADEGVGGRRSSGRGFFQNVELVDSPHHFPDDGPMLMTLSTYFPKRDEVDTLYSYELEKRNGYIYSRYGTSLRKKSILTIREGSLLKDEVEGQILDIKPVRFPDHPVYFYGKPLLVGFGGDSR